MPKKEILITSGRTDLADFFELSGKFKGKLKHYPFLAFVENSEGVINVLIVKEAIELMALSDDTKIMSQWRGNWSSDYFQFTVGDVRKHLAGVEND